VTFMKGMIRVGRWANEHKHAAAAILDKQTFYLDVDDPPTRASSTSTWSRTCRRRTSPRSRSARTSCSGTATSSTTSTCTSGRLPSSRSRPRRSSSPSGGEGHEREARPRPRPHRVSSAPDGTGRRGDHQDRRGGRCRVGAGDWASAVGGERAGHRLAVARSCGELDDRAGDDSHRHREHPRAGA